MKTLAQLKTELDAANLLLQKAVRKGIRAGRGPIHRPEYNAALVAYRAWEAELSRTEEAARQPVTA